MAVVYSCCFWFSLRLGGIIIGFVAIINATIGLVLLSIVYNQPQDVQHQINMMIKNLNLVHVVDYMENLEADPQKYIGYFITLCCIYIIACILYIYGAYKCNNVLMIPFILVEFIRLISLSIIVTTWLIVLKQNTMDIGLLIGASVASGFVLLGMFYLWVCAATLPILVIEIEREEQMAIVNKLQRLLDNNQRFNGNLNSTFEDYDENLGRRGLFVIPSYNKKYDSRKMTNNYYTSRFIH